MSLFMNADFLFSSYARLIPAHCFFHFLLTPLP